VIGFFFDAGASLYLVQTITRPDGQLAVQVRAMLAPISAPHPEEFGQPPPDPPSPVCLIPLDTFTRRW
jgi:hypothetical protein